ncbi:MAG: glucan biosynthesis protein [Akkermansiaceae bacterium]|nr:glucan biosynthesis protein [Akkermansiaceae bacterium]MCP5542643.1 glucan biosynthesis protein [Akkermansiaceae bacterium]MCP5548244.1 glucan biosynthesis protein [Akkermansiaceae bacterium]
MQNRARELAAKPYEAPDKDALPAWMRELSYDQYRDIRFNPAQALWAADQLPFRAMLFHPGYLFREPVTLNEFTQSHQQRIRFAEAFFDYGPLVSHRGELPQDGGFSGFRLHTPLNRPDVYDELVVFQGASYWRALGRGQKYGISSRGIAVDTGVDGTNEEFPAFREFWLRKPEKGDTQARIYALLDGPSFAGAYAFRVHPDDETQVEVRAVLFCRKEVKRFGVAPMSSMFWFGENSRRRFDDFRPEVHDSDGLAIRMGSGERIWRPLSNDSGGLGFSVFPMEKCDGFGLLQRDRRFAAYEDGEADYHLRPSLWIEPTSDWGAGHVLLMEIPTGNELSDNIVAMWEPGKTPKPGERVEFSYRQHWTEKADASEAGGIVTATRTGVHDWQPEMRTMIVEFSEVAPAKEDGPALAAEVRAVGESAKRVKVENVTVQPLPGGRWRVAFQLTPGEGVAKLAEAGPVEMRCCLKRGDDFLTETWAYRVNP